MVSELVSVLIPAFDAREWISETIESALAQTWPNKEIIIVDDGSTDGSYEIAKTYENRCVKVIRQANAGSGSARNRALQVAQGGVIQWLDHDDLLSPNKIAEQVHKSGISADSRILSSSAFGRFYFRPQRARFVRNSVWRNLTPIEYLLDRFRYSVWFQTGAWLVSRKVTEMAGPWLEIKTPDDDGEYFCRVVSASSEIRFVPSAISYWRVGNPWSLSRRDTVALDGLFACRMLCISHLRALEDSPRTRSACVQYLQSCAGDFYVERPDIFEKAQMLARELGGELKTPRHRGKYLPIQVLFGYGIAKDLASNLALARDSIAREMDRLMYRLSL